MNELIEQQKAQVDSFHETSKSIKNKMEPNHKGVTGIQFWGVLCRLHHYTLRWYRILSNQRRDYIICLQTGTRNKAGMLCLTLSVSPRRWATSTTHTEEWKHRRDQIWRHGNQTGSICWRRHMLCGNRGLIEGSPYLARNIREVVWTVNRAKFISPKALQEGKTSMLGIPTTDRAKVLAIWIGTVNSENNIYTTGILNISFPRSRVSVTHGHIVTSHSKGK